MAEKKKKPVEKWVMTVEPEVFAAWKKCQRRNDIKEIAEGYGCSDPTVLKALKYGHVHDTGLLNFINNFFLDRLRSERDQTSELIRLAEAATTK